MKLRTRVFADRNAAGVELARELERRIWGTPVVVLGLPRGGVPVAWVVARALGAALDVLVVRKIGMPGQPELAIGAIAPGDIMVHEPEFAGVSASRGAAIERIAEQERCELKRREQVYRAGRAPLDLKGKTVVLVDDGLATGCTMLAAVRATHTAGAARIIVASPVASVQGEALLRPEADEVVVLQTPPMLSSIGQWYEQCEQLEDAEVCRLLALGRPARPPT